MAFPEYLVGVEFDVEGNLGEPVAGTWAVDHTEIREIPMGKGHRIQEQAPSDQVSSRLLPCLANAWKS